MSFQPHGNQHAHTPAIYLAKHLFAVFHSQRSTIPTSHLAPRAAVDVV